MFDRAYFNNDYIFVETVLANHIPVPVENECHSYFPVVDGLEGTLTRVFEDIGLGGEFENFENDIESTFGDIAKYLKKEYKKITGNPVSLKERGEGQNLKTFLK